MLTYSFENKGSDSLYEYLYKQIKADIVNGTLAPDEKLPSKRSLAKHLSVSTITVENAYNQLTAEGYLYSVAKSGFYVSDITSYKPVSSDRPQRTPLTSDAHTDYFADFVNNSTTTDTFPFATWTRLLRETMSEHADKLMERSPSAGIMELRSAIADYLYQFRGMSVEPEQIIVGAGTEYLYGLLIQLLGRDKIYAVEDPGYQKITKIYQSNEVNCVPISLDSQGIPVNRLLSSGADILHISPAHHFPTGIVTPVSRRYELLSWAASGERHIIEDDYDSEFRFDAHPKPAMQTMDGGNRVIYMNTFSKSLAPSIRISYMVLPAALMAEFRRRLGFYSCTVPSFEQYTLARFLSRGHFEKHINRMRKFYKQRRNTVVSLLQNCAFSEFLTILEQDAGLHFLVRVKTRLTDRQLTEGLAKAGIQIRALSDYYHDAREDMHCLVVNYSGIKEEDLVKALKALEALEDIM